MFSFAILIHKSNGSNGYGLFRNKLYHLIKSISMCVYYNDNNNDHTFEHMSNMICKILLIVFKSINWIFHFKSISLNNILSSKSHDLRIKLHGLDFLRDLSHVIT